MSEGEGSTLGAGVGDFTGQAAHYVARPGYPEGLVDRLMERVGVVAGDAVADIGAGTGLFSRLLGDRGMEVTAVEPNAEMAGRAAGHEGVAWVEGAFEATGLGEGSQGWVTAAQAFHWAEPMRALPEMRRVLREGGWFTVLWNDRVNERSGWLGEVRGLMRRYAPGFDELYRARDWAGVLRSTGDFAEVERDEAAHVVVMSAERFVGLWRSHNRLTAAAGVAGMTGLIGELEGMLGEAGVDEVEVPYVCRAWSARRV